MPFIPHTEADVAAMLETIGVADIKNLFREIPTDLPAADLASIASGLNEFQALQHMQQKAKADNSQQNFIGAGAYEHYIPAAVWQIASRGEYLTAYTPYQAEASQGTLQLIYEYQTMMANLLGMEVSNASMYGGATALAESILMAVRLQKKLKNPCVLVPGSLHPHYRQTLQTLLQLQNIKIIEVPYCATAGKTLLASLDQYAAEEIAAVVINNPNFFGQLEAVDELTDWAHQHNALAIACVNPIAMALFKQPGVWGSDDAGVDIACGEGQPLGVPLASGGPYFGFMCCRKQFVRQMPGRIVGRSQDGDGNTAYTLTLQAREQHIRRAKATSNICTNQGLLVTAATIYMSLMGPQGLYNVATQCNANTRLLRQLVSEIAGVEILFAEEYFHEFVVRLPKSASHVLAAMSQRSFAAGLDLGRYYNELQDCILLCATEVRAAAEIEQFASNLRQVLEV